MFYDDSYKMYLVLQY